MESDDKSSTQPFEENSLLNLEEMSAENQRQADEADSLINNSAIQAIVDKFNLDNFAKNHPLADDIENSVRELIKENIKLKETLKCSNDSAIRHFKIVEKWLEDTRTTQKDYKRKLDEARVTIEELKTKNAELRKPLQEKIWEYQRVNRRLALENKDLREKCEQPGRGMQLYDQSVHSMATDNDSEISRMYKKLEESERERRKLMIERDRFVGQEMKIQQILGAGDTRNVTNLCYWNHQFPDVITTGQKETKLKEELKEFDKILQSEVSFSQANPVPESSSSNLSDDVKEENTVEQMKEEISTLRKQVLNERAVCTLCRKLLSEARPKFRVIYQLTLVLLKEHESKIRSLEISLVKAKNDIDLTSLRHDLSDKQNRLVQLESEIAIMKEKLDVANKMTEHYFILQTQIKVYEEDFLTMRNEKDSLAREKHRLELNLRALTQENAKLKKQCRVSDESDKNNLTNSEQSVSQHYQYKCINDMCTQSFASEDELQTHIYSCLNLKD